MTAVAAPADQAGERSRAGSRAYHIGLHTALIILMIIWAIPTLGLFVNSFRPRHGARSAAGGGRRSSRRTSSPSTTTCTC